MIMCAANFRGHLLNNQVFDSKSLEPYARSHLGDVFGHIIYDLQRANICPFYVEVIVWPAGSTTEPPKWQHSHTEARSVFF